MLRAVVGAWALIQLKHSGPNLADRPRATRAAMLCIEVGIWASRLMEKKNSGHFFVSLSLKWPLLVEVVMQQCDIQQEPEHLPNLVHYFSLNHFNFFSLSQVLKSLQLHSK